MTEMIRKIFNEIFGQKKKELSFEEVADKLPSVQDRGDEGSFSLWNSDDSFDYYVGTFYNPDETHQLFVGVWAVSKEQDPTLGWDQWIGWFFKDFFDNPCSRGTFMEETL